MYEDRVLAFIDVLGFSDSIKKTMVEEVEDENETKRINNLIENVQWQLNYGKENFDDSLRNSKIVNQFSDSLIISYLMTEESGIFQILLDILYLCATALQNGFLLRGAIVCDKVYHTEKKVFGPALVKAYEMENKMAVYPRIILDDSILNIAKSYHSINHNADEEMKFIEKLLLLDFDGLYYVNYFDAIESELDSGIEGMPEYLEWLRKIIEKMGGIETISVKSKYLWLKEKYNIIIAKYKENYNNERARNEYPELYEYYKMITLL
jgi:hypothetical protein